MNTDMDSTELFTTDWHPDENQLLLALDKELSSDDAAKIEQHLGKCWSCRARSEEMQRGILAFVEYRERRYLPSLPEPPQDFRSFPQQLRDAVREPESPGWFRRLRDRLRNMLIPRWRVQWASVIAGFIAIVIFWVHVLLVPSSLTAAEVLSQAIAAQNPPPRSAGNRNLRWTAHQKVRIRVGEQTMIRDFKWTAGGPVPQARWDPATDAANWNSPLTAAGFAAWHDGLERKTDRINRWGDRLTLITKPADNPIREASLVVRFSDFHPIEQRIQFTSGREVQIREIEFAIVVEKIAPPRNGTRSSRASATALPTGGAVRQTPRRPDLDDIELEIRYRMFRQQFDLGEDVKVSRVADRIIVSGIASSSERARNIRSLLNDMPGVRVSITMPEQESSVSVPERPQNTPALVSSVPVLEEALEARFGSDEERRQFVDRCLTASDAALSHAWALRNLAERYKAPNENLLSPSSRTKLHEMLSAHLDKLGAFTGELKPLLEMLPSGPVPKAELPADWNGTALSLFKTIQEQDSSVESLVTVTDQPVQSKQTLVEKFRFTYNRAGVLQDRLKTLIP
jgi:anti-sigma factor RsiW